MNKFIPCRTCPALKKESPREGYYFDIKSGCPILVECDCHKKWRKEKELSAYYKISNINPNFNFNDYVGTNSILSKRCLESFADNFNNYINRTMIYLYGPNGTQKTSLSMCTAKTIINKGYTVQYVLMNNLISALVTETGAFKEDDEDTQRFLKRSRECDLLIIDESFDKSKVTLYKSGYQIPFLDSFLRDRFELNNKSIMFISNIKPYNIENAGYGRSLQDLIVRNTTSTLLEFYDNYIECSNKNISPADFFGVK